MILLSTVALFALAAEMFGIYLIVSFNNVPKESLLKDALLAPFTPCLTCVGMMHPLNMFGWGHSLPEMMQC